MTVMIIDHYAGSPAMGMEYRPYYIAKYWSMQGHKVIIICASYSHLRHTNPKGKGPVWEERREGVTYVFIKTPAYSKNNVARIKNIGAFLSGLRKYEEYLAQKYSPNVVISSSTYPFDIFTAVKIANKQKAKLVYEIHDLWPLSLTELHHFHKRSPIIMAVKAAQKYSTARADLVVSMVQQGERYLLEQGLRPRRYQYIPNGVETHTKSWQQTEADEACIEFVGNCKASGCFVVMYVGGFAQGNYLDILIQAAALLNENVKVILVGDGMEKERLKNLSRQQGTNNIHFFPSIPKDKVQALLQKADCLYIGTSPSLLYQYGVAMNKLFDYMLAARPILFSTNAKNTPVQQADCGIIVPAGKAQFVAEGLRKLLLMPESERAVMGTRGREYCCRYHDYERISQKFMEAIMKL